MPELPTLTVTDAQAQRILQTFGSALAYRQWLRRQIIVAVSMKDLTDTQSDLEAEFGDPT